MNLFELSAELKLDSSNYESGISKAKKTASAAAKAIGTVFTAAAAAVGAITTSAVNAYGEFQQLKGGVETLFGNSADVILNYAKDAYMNAQLSANEYMEQATSFSAALIQSLGGDTEAAAEYANMAITDMSDNANKMGTSIESIQNAYQGFSKQNYTMLDNLKLGYGGTKQEMERLIADANKLRKAQGKNADLTIDSYADVVEAIHTVQEEMGIAGVTAEESETTIQGSLRMTKAAWDNLLTGMANGETSYQDLTRLTKNFASSAATAFRNITPAIKAVFSNLPEVLKQIMPAVVDLIEELLPDLITSASTLITSLAAALPDLLKTLADSLPEIFSGLTDALDEIITGLVDMADELFGGIGLPEAWEQLKTDLSEFWDETSPYLKTIFTELVKLVGDLVSAFLGVEEGEDGAKTGATTFGEAVKSILGIVKKVVIALADFLTWLNNGSEGAGVARAAIMGLVLALGGLKVGGVISGAITGITKLAGAFGGGKIVGTGASAKVVGGSGLVGGVLVAACAVESAGYAIEGFKEVMNNKPSTLLMDEAVDSVTLLQDIIESTGLSASYMVDDMCNVISLKDGQIIASGAAMMGWLESGMSDNYHYVGAGKVDDEFKNKIMVTEARTARQAGKKLSDELGLGLASKDFERLGRSLNSKIGAGFFYRASVIGTTLGSKIANGVKSVTEIKTTGGWLVDQLNAGINNKKKTILDNLVSMIKDALKKSKKKLNDGVGELKPTPLTKSVPLTQGISSMSGVSNFNGVTINVNGVSGDGAAIAQDISNELKRMTIRRTRVWK